MMMILSIVGCGGSSIPTDEEMIQNFFMHETAFDELYDIVSQRPCGRYYPPYNVSMLYGDDSASVEGLSEKEKSRLDSLLAAINCERIFYWTGTIWCASEGNVPYTSINIPYFSRGLSIGGTSKEYVYEPHCSEKRMPLTDSSLELNDVYGWRDTILYKSIKGNWYIMLLHDN